MSTSVGKRAGRVANELLDEIGKAVTYWVAMSMAPRLGSGIECMEAARQDCVRLLERGLLDWHKQTQVGGGYTKGEGR